MILQKELAARRPKEKETEMVFLTSHQPQPGDELDHVDQGESVLDVPHETVFAEPEHPQQEEPPKQVPKPALLTQGTPTSTSRTTTNKYGKPVVHWTRSPMRVTRKILEICTWTMMLSNVAQESNPLWQVCTPVSIEHGYNLLTKEGRDAGERYIKRQKPDLLVGEWMCGPFSSMQNLNLGKGGKLADKFWKSNDNTRKYRNGLPRWNDGKHK